MLQILRSCIVHIPKIIFVAAQCSVWNWKWGKNRKWPGLGHFSSPPKTSMWRFKFFVPANFLLHCPHVNIYICCSLSSVSGVECRKAWKWQGLGHFSSPPKTSMWRFKFFVPANFLLHCPHVNIYICCSLSSVSGVECRKAWKWQGLGHRHGAAKVTGGEGVKLKRTKNVNTRMHF